MIGIAFILIAFAMADLVAGGLIGQPQGFRRSALGLIAAAVVIVLFGIGYGFDFFTTALSTVFGIVAIGGWLLLKSMSLGHKSIRNSKLALAWLSAFLLATLLLTPYWQSTLNPDIERWLQALPLHFLEQSGTSRAIAFIGVMLFLTAPANAAELNRAARDTTGASAPTFHVDIITEYFLLGSLLSWTIALFSAMFFLVAS